MRTMLLVIEKVMRTKMIKSMSMGTSIWMIMMMSMNMRMKMNMRMMKMKIRMVKMQMENLDNFFDGSLRVCKRDLTLDAQKLNKPER